jgi:hypothetical protein
MSVALEFERGESGKWCCHKAGQIVPETEKTLLNGKSIDLNDQLIDIGVDIAIA